MPPLQTVNILIVDDVEATNTLLRGLVLNVFDAMPGDWSCNIFQAYNGKKAMELVTSQKIHLAFLDIELPDHNGLALLDSIKHVHPNCKSIIVTGNGTRKNVVSAISGGVLGFIIKPFNKARFKEAIDNFLKQFSKLEATKKVSGKKKLIDLVKETHG